MCYAQAKKKKNVFYVSKDVHPQNIDVIRTRAEPIGVKVVVSDYQSMDFSKDDVCGVLIQYPGTDGNVIDYASFVEKVRNFQRVFLYNRSTKLELWPSLLLICWH